MPAGLRRSRLLHRADLRVGGGQGGDHLRAIGMRRGQLAQMVTAESARSPHPRVRSTRCPTRQSTLAELARLEGCRHAPGGSTPTPPSRSAVGSGWRRWSRITPPCHGLQHDFNRPSTPMPEPVLTAASAGGRVHGIGCGERPRGGRCHEGGAMNGCDCLDWRVYGHVCVGLAPPGRGESSDWRSLPSRFRHKTRAWLVPAQERREHGNLRSQGGA